MSNFEQAHDYLLRMFAQHDFLGLYHSKKQESIAIHTCENGTVISICFPGYKTEVSGNKVKYDYRIDITRVNDEPVALSHTNIITDIYNKITVGKMNARELCRALIYFSKTGLIDLDELSEKLLYIPVKPSPILLNLSSTKKCFKYNLLSIAVLIYQFSDEINHPSKTLKKHLAL